MDIKQLFGHRVKELRNKKGISQEKLAEFSDLHRTYISSIELGKRNVALENIARLAKALDCNIEDLFKSTVN